MYVGTYACFLLSLFNIRSVETFTPQFVLLEFVTPTNTSNRITVAYKHSRTITGLVSDYLKEQGLPWGIDYQGNEDYHVFINRTCINKTTEKTNILELHTRTRSFSYHYVYVLSLWVNNQITQEFIIPVKKVPDVEIKLISGEVSIFTKKIYKTS